MVFNPHDPKIHSKNCDRLVEEDDFVIRVFCGAYTYHPTLPCTCGADTTTKTEK